MKFPLKVDMDRQGIIDSEGKMVCTSFNIEYNDAVKLVKRANAYEELISVVDDNERLISSNRELASIMKCMLLDEKIKTLISTKMYSTIQNELTRSQTFEDTTLNNTRELKRKFRKLF